MLQHGVRTCGDVLENLEQEASPGKTLPASQVQGHASGGGPPCLAGVREDRDGLGVVASGRRDVDQGAFQAYARQRPGRLQGVSEAGDPVDPHPLDRVDPSVLVDRDMDGGRARGRRVGSGSVENQD
jgi:hypothetical protein